MPESPTHSTLSPFVVILVMTVLSLVGVLCLPRLNVQYTPTSLGRGISVSYSLPDASAEMIEVEATSLIEGALSTIGGVTDISSVSRKGSGYVSVYFRKGTDMDAARFEVASAIRNVWASLPSGLSYPNVRYSSGGGRQTAISYTIKGPIPSQEIERYAREHILSPLAALKDVEDVSISGATPWHWVITFDADKATAAGISADDIAKAFSGAHTNSVLGMTQTNQGQMVVRLRGPSHLDFGDIPVKRVGGRVLYLRDLATWHYEESSPTAYYRVNGLNTINISVSISEASNLLTAVRSIKERMVSLQGDFPKEITADIAYDASEFVSSELQKIYYRTGLCVLILLLFVFLVSRSWRYLCVITATLAVNILTALGIYALAGLQIHIYTLAGITVSLGIIIDTSIVMADHYGHWNNRGVFPALFVATATTIAALLMILVLPESERKNLTDFIWVIAINLTLSLAIAYLFIPSLMEYISVRQEVSKISPKRLRCRARFSSLYKKYIAWGIRHRWILIGLFVLSFAYPFYSFYKALDRSDFYRQPVKKQLYIGAGMLEGSTVNQLNEIVREMENFLAGFEEISVFTTSILSYDNATIVVEFKPEYEKTSFPMQLKTQVTSMAINFGGANWSISGLDNDSFSNQIVLSYKSDRIILKGYNYQELLKYAMALIDRLSKNRRVQAPEIWSRGLYGRPALEFNMAYDYEAITASGINPHKYYSTMASRLYDRRIGSVMMDGVPTDVVLQSSDLASYDLWHVLHSPVTVDSLKMTLSNVGSIRKERSGMEIRKSAQSYQVDVCFDFIGNYELSKMAITDAVNYMNDEVLPIGFIAKADKIGMFDEHKERYAWLILLIVSVVFIILAMAFESLKLPLAIIFTIPISFIGLFLVFAWSGFSFDQGGFAALVMLCGIVVNAGIYLLYAWRSLGGSTANRLDIRIRHYVKAFAYKATPILLTLSSTVLGLIPFLSDGPEEVFWFDFAAGTIGGIVFSLIALVLYLPVFSIPRKKPKTTP